MSGCFLSKIVFFSFVLGFGFVLFILSTWFDKTKSYFVIMYVLNSFSAHQNSSGKSTVSESVLWLVDITRSHFEMCEMFQSENKFSPRWSHIQVVYLVSYFIKSANLKSTASFKRRYKRMRKHLWHHAVIVK